MRPEAYIEKHLKENGITLASVADRADIKYQRLRYALLEGELTARELLRVCTVLQIDMNTMMEAVS